MVLKTRDHAGLMPTPSPSDSYATTPATKLTFRANLVPGGCVHDLGSVAPPALASPPMRAEADAALLRLARLMGRLAARAEMATAATDGPVLNLNPKDVS